MSDLPDVQKGFVRKCHQPRVLKVDAGSKRRPATMTITVPEPLAVEAMQQMLGRGNKNSIGTFLLVWDQKQ